MLIWLGSVRGRWGGGDFAVGEEVELSLVPLASLDGEMLIAVALGPDLYRELTHLEVLGSVDADLVPEMTRVRIESIRVTHWRFDMSTERSVHLPIPGSAVFEDREAVDRQEDLDDVGFAGWLVSAIEIN